jgi:DNA-binding FadR family transcriptional regulator
MSEPLLYQLRLHLSPDAARTARSNPADPSLSALAAILARHKAAMKCQLDAFLDYVHEAEANGTADYPLYQWTKATVEDPAKQAKHQRVFTLYVDQQEVYPKPQADALEAELSPLVGGGVIERLAKYDSDPAHNPQPPARQA